MPNRRDSRKRIRHYRYAPQGRHISLRMLMTVLCILGALAAGVRLVVYLANSFRAQEVNQAASALYHGLEKAETFETNAPLPLAGTGVW